MDDSEAFELIDAHLDRQPLTDEQSDALSAWIRTEPQRADEAFFRIFLHSYLRMRLQAGLISGGSDVSVLSGVYRAPVVAGDEASGGLAGLLTDAVATGRRNRRRAAIRWLTGSAALVIAAVAGWWGSGWYGAAALFGVPEPASHTFAYEGFDYPATPLPTAAGEDFRWPTSGGMQDLDGGSGWAEPWQETNSKVAIIVDYARQDTPWESKDMRKFGPLGYSDSNGNVLRSAGHQMRTATSPRSITTRRFDLKAFPTSMQDEKGLGRDGSVMWLSLLAQSSLSTAENNRYSYLVIGSKVVAGFRIGKLGAAPLGNWTAVGLMTGDEVNLKSSMFPSGEMVFLVTRIVFRPGPEDATVWINPRLDAEPQAEDASLKLQVPDFRFDGIAIHANHSTDFDELRFGGTFRSVTPLQPKTALPAGG